MVLNSKCCGRDRSAKLADKFSQDLSAPQSCSAVRYRTLQVSGQSTMGVLSSEESRQEGHHREPAITRERRRFSKATSQIASHRHSHRVEHTLPGAMKRALLSVARVTEWLINHTCNNIHSQSIKKPTGVLSTQCIAI